MSKQIERNYVAEFKDAFGAAVENIVRAASIYVEAIDENPKLKERFINELADIVPASQWSRMEAVGRKWLHPKLLMGGGGVNASKIKSLPYSDQEAIFSGQMYDMLTGDGHILKVDLATLSPEQADQMIDRNRIRKLGEQKAWLEARKTGQTVGHVEVLPYVITDGKISFRRGTVLSRAELKRLLAEM